MEFYQRENDKNVIISHYRIDRICIRLTKKEKKE